MALELLTSVSQQAVTWVAHQTTSYPPFRTPFLPQFFCEAATLGSQHVQVGITDIFSVPGDFNLTLFYHLIAEPGLNLIGCCNELNALYATDVIARSCGVSACVITFTIDGLSVPNAFADAYSENFPLICIVVGLNSKDYGTQPNRPSSRSYLG
ncbi:pyruvate decarboxylase 2-like [Senna tora]|uniref:pyruvate decarboxylase n=1 Tax=Senna tora TaxID=362788 RepID=A0A834TM89_9FABA|nr:pyruvate decarboxylase 2-like [Senna tora]